MVSKHQGSSRHLTCWAIKNDTRVGLGIHLVESGVANFVGGRRSGAKVASAQHN